MNDYQRISNLIGRYGQIVDEWPRQPDAYAELFTEDAGPSSPDSGTLSWFFWPRIWAQILH